MNKESLDTIITIGDDGVGLSSDDEKLGRRETGDEKNEKNVRFGTLRRAAHSSSASSTLHHQGLPCQAPRRLTARP